MIYITGDTNLGTFFWRFHKSKFGGAKNTYLIIVGDTGMSLKESYEASYKLAWFEDQPCTTLIVANKPSTYGWDCDIEDREWHGGKICFCRPNVICLHDGQVYEIDNLKFLVLNEAIKSDDLVNLEVDYILATRLEVFENVKNKIKFKYCYIGESNKAMQEDGSVILLDEDIQEIMSI